MRKLLPLFAAVLAACSSSDSGPSYAVSDSAVAFDSAAGCALDASTTVGVSIAVVNLTDYTTPTACASMQGNTVAANGAAAGLLLVRADFTTSGGPAPGLAQETYPYFDIATLAPPASKIPPFDAAGKAAFFTGALVKCPGAARSAINGGSVTVTAVNETAGTISGSVDASLEGGGSIKGTFTASRCTGVPDIDVCAAVQALSLNLTPPACQ